MKYVLSKIITNGQEPIIHNYGDRTFEFICDNFPGWFTIKSVANCPDILPGLALRTKVGIIRCVLANVIEEYAHAPKDCPLTRIGKIYRWRNSLNG